jgi:hypothetical protein
MQYDDASALECHHCACTFEILEDPKCNIFSRVGPNEYELIRDMMVEAILQTDIALHFHLVVKFSARLQRLEPFSKENKQDKQLLVNILLHAADISNVMKPWNLSKCWSMHVQEEFFKQGDKEKSMGLPVSMFMDRNEYNQAQMSLGFIDFVALPLVTRLTKMLPKMEVMMNCLHDNRQQWSEIEEEKQNMEQQV